MVQVATEVSEPRTQRFPDSGELVDERLVLCYFASSLILIVVAMFAGFFFSLQFLQVYPFPGIEPLSPGRWRMVHTSALLYGFIANAFLGGLHWAVPRLTLRPVLSRRLSWLIFFAWQAVVVAIMVGLVLGHAQAIEWGETPVWTDQLVLVGLFLVAVNFLTPIFRSTGPLYVSLWYVIAGLVGAILAYAVGNFAPKPFVGGLAGGVAGMFIHDPVGLFITPIGWGLMYYFVPIILKTPIWSHRLALVGFWGLTFFYPLNAVHHLLRGSTPMFLANENVISTVVVGFVVITVIVNFFATVYGNGSPGRTNVAIRWFYLGMVFYLMALVQYAAQVTTAVSELIPWTDWVVGHAHLVLFGAFGFWIMGMMTHLFPRLLGADGWYNPKWNVWHFRLSGIGMFVMFLDLIIAGLVQGFLWNQLAPWDESVTTSAPFWLVRTASGVAIIVGQFFLIFNILMTAIHKRSVPVTAGAAPVSTWPVAQPIDSSAGTGDA